MAKFPIDYDGNNPAFQLFGLRLFGDQTVEELLIEFLLIAFSEKKIGEDIQFETALPDFEIIRNWERNKLFYAPKARLNLKLFSFLNASNLELRHISHRNHYKELLGELKNKITASGNDKYEIIQTLNDLFLGFLYTGKGRTFSAQSFLPISRSFLAGESIWSVTAARNPNIKQWNDLFDGQVFFERNKHAFLARGGEVIYLQLCNAFRRGHEEIIEWNKKFDLGLIDEEQDPRMLHNELNILLQDFIGQCPKTLEELAEFVDTHLESNTSQRIDYQNNALRYTSAEFCNSNSWPESYLFAVELCRILKSDLGIVDKIQVLETAFAFQVIRTLAFASSRVNNADNGLFPGYFFVVSAPSDSHSIVKRISQYSVKENEKSIFQALRNEDVVELPNENDARIKILKEADQKYGGKLFLKISKKIGFVVPPKGQGARFTINEQILRYLVLSIVPPGERLTYTTFLSLMEKRLGIVIGANGIMKANQSTTGQETYITFETDDWFKSKLNAAGFLIHLSDSFALVHNSK